MDAGMPHYLSLSLASRCMPRPIRSPDCNLAARTLRRSTRCYRLGAGVTKSRLGLNAGKKQKMADNLMIGFPAPSVTSNHQV